MHTAVLYLTAPGFGVTPGSRLLWGYGLGLGFVLRSWVARRVAGRVKGRVKGSPKP